MTIKTCKCLHPDNNLKEKIAAKVVKKAKELLCNEIPDGKYRTYDQLLIIAAILINELERRKIEIDKELEQEKVLGANYDYPPQ